MAKKNVVVKATKTTESLVERLCRCTTFSKVRAKTFDASLKDEERAIVNKSTDKELQGKCFLILAARKKHDGK